MGSRDPRVTRATFSPGTVSGRHYTDQLYEDGGGGGSGGGPSRVYSLQMQGFCLPCLCLLPPGPFPREGD